MGVTPVFALLLLTACQPTFPTPGSPLPPEPAPGDCGASAMQGFVGQPESVLAATTFAVPIRIIHPGDAITMDYSPTRLNFEIDARGRIARIFCG